MRKSLVYVLIAVAMIAMIMATLTIDSYSTWEQGQRATEQHQTSEAWLHECQNRTPVPVLLDGKEWDLSACG